MIRILFMLAITCSFCMVMAFSEPSASPREVQACVSVGGERSAEDFPATFHFRASEPGDTDLAAVLLSGGDGVTELVHRGRRSCIANKPDQQPPSTFLYFSVPKVSAWDSAMPAYVEVVYYDNKPDMPLTLEYDSNSGDAIEDLYRPAEEQWGGARFGARTWRRAVFLLRQPRFTGRQNLGADFRIGVGDLYVHEITVSVSPPPGLDKLAAARPPQLLSKTQIGSDRRFIIGGFDMDSAASMERQKRALRNALPALKAMGLTSHEAYVRWNLCEPEPGVYDWRLYDAYVEVYREAGVKWVPFLIIGSAYSLPDWYYKQPGSQGYVCLEHGGESDVESLWNPVLRGHVARFIQAFCDHYRDSGIIESILLGITGNYGEAIYVATGNDWMANTHGEYHSHAGFWAGDPYAREDFRNYLRGKYGAVERLNLAWDSSFGRFEDIEPFLRENAPCDRAWLDFGHWYIGAMNEYTRFWLETTRQHFPGLIEVCTGGHAPVEHGADFGMQCKIAAASGAGVRITNEASDYRANFSLTRWVASAGRQYGAYYSFEPAGMVDERGVVARIYNATASDARGLHFYYPNLFGSERAQNNFIRWATLFRGRRPVVEIAAYYPQTHIMLHGNKFLDRVQPLRDHFDFAYCSDDQIADGGLEQFKILMLLWGDTAEQETWEAIADWVRRGGVLITPDSIGPLRTVEGEPAVLNALLSGGADTGGGRVLVYGGHYESAEYGRFISESLANAGELSGITRYMVQADGREDQVFASAVGPRDILWLNMTDHAQTCGTIKIGPGAIVNERVTAGKVRSGCR